MQAFGLRLDQRRTFSDEPSPGRARTHRTAASRSLDGQLVLRGGPQLPGQAGGRRGETGWARVRLPEVPQTPTRPNATLTRWVYAGTETHGHAVPQLQRSGRLRLLTAGVEPIQRRPPQGPNPQLASLAQTPTHPETQRSDTLDAFICA